MGAAGRAAFCRLDTTSQSVYGAQIDKIQDQMNGKPDTGLFVQALLGGLWTYPADVQSSDGLGGGITWAWDPELCATLFPLFTEHISAIQFITCEDLQATVARGFASWSANNRFIHFLDVTQECEKLGLLHSGQADMEHGGCPLAEIWVTSEGSDRRELQSRMETEDEEQSELSGSTAIATAKTYVRISSPSKPFRFTSGVEPFVLRPDGPSTTPMHLGHWHGAAMGPQPRAP